MTFWQKHKWKILAPVLIVLVLAAAFIFGDRNMPKQKDPLAQPTVAAPVETPAQNAAESNTPDKVETEPTQTPTENVSEPSDDPQADKPARTDTEPPENLHRLIPNSQNTFRRRKSRQVQPANMKKWAA